MASHQPWRALCLLDKQGNRAREEKEGIRIAYFYNSLSSGNQWSKSGFSLPTLVLDGALSLKKRAPQHFFLTSPHSFHIYGRPFTGLFKVTDMEKYCGEKGRLPETFPFRKR